MADGASCGCCAPKGCELRLLVCGFMRKELKFDSLDELVTAIREDGEFCRNALDRQEVAKLKTDPWFAAESSGRDSVAGAAGSRL